MLRRFLNATIAGIALIALAIPLLIVALLIKLTSPGPALFRQPRVGKSGRQFEILKFRTMIADTSQQSAITVGHDARITPIGSFLRKTKIDELPQLINVLQRRHEPWSARALSCRSSCANIPPPTASSSSRSNLG